VLVVSAGEIAAAFSTYAAHHFAGVSRAKAESRLPLFLVVYLGAAAVASLAISRFAPARALRRFPLVVVFGAVGVAAMLAAFWIGAHSAGAGDGSAQGGDGGPSADEATKPKRSPRPSRPTLASALADEELAALALGGYVTGPSRSTDRRMGSTCSYEGEDGSA
jgi:hypothetical protein